MLALNGLRDLVDWVSHADKMSVARLAPAIFEAASRGDAETRAIIRRGAEILAQFTHAVLTRLEFRNAPVCLFGGLFSHHPEYASLFEDRLRTLSPDVKVSVCHKSGALGSAWLAGGTPASSEVCQSTDQTPADPTKTPDLAELASASTEQRNPRSAEMDRMSTLDLVDLFITEEDRVPEELTACQEPLSRAIDITSDALGKGGRLFYVGAGTSGRLGVLDASEIPPTFGASPELVQGIIAGGARALHSAVEGAEDQSEAGALALIERGVRAGDVVCGLTASGRTPFVLGALGRATELGARTILITCNPARRRTAAWEVEIDLPTGSELLTGSTRLKAGTATKLALNILSTCTMIRLGKVRGNSMVGVRVSNEKLRNRGVRLVSEALGLSYEESLRRLEAAGWDVRACIETSPTH
jgi:N-acetylmuramic acid 6-phosphate etherase